MTDGTVVACPAAVGADEWNMEQHTFAECWRRSPGLTRWRELVASESCEACFERDSCGGACRARALAAGLTFSDPDQWACEARGVGPKGE